ncbi:MAG: OsmC family peroxiredoxin [Chloroflexota bacterium]|nr:OsmC family peroxiredoxin [Chloroflexota bacterium]
MAAVRRAEAIWRGDLMSGKGEVSGVSSGTVTGLDVSWARRSEPDANAVTSPEELLAAAHASCFAMALSGNLARAGSPPEELHVAANVTFDRVGDGFKVVSSALEVEGRVPNMDQAAFQQAAEAARDGCPISGALKGNVELSVKASLQS